MIAELVKFVLAGSCLGALISGLLTWRFRQQVRRIEFANRLLYHRLAPDIEIEITVNLPEVTMTELPPSMWR